MNGDDLQVIPEDLQAKAAQIRELPWASAAAQPALNAADALDASIVAAANLAVNAEAIWSYQEFGRLEGLRLAQTLENVASAYAEVDRVAGENLDDTVGGSGAPMSADGARHPEIVTLPAPPHPPAMPIPKGSLVSEQLLYPPEAQRALEAGDGGAALTTAAQHWRNNARSLDTSARLFETKGLQWEGDAADAAYSKFVAYQLWLMNLAVAWDQLAGEADRIVAAHTAARQDNEPIAEDFAALQRAIAQEPASADNLSRMVQMAALQTRSEEIRHRYARDGQPRQIQPPDPPAPVVTGAPVNGGDDRRAATSERSPTGEIGALLDDDSPSLGEPRASQSLGHRAQPPLPEEQPSPGIDHGDSPASGQPGGSRGDGLPGTGLPSGTPPIAPTPVPDSGLRPAALSGRPTGSGGGGGTAAPRPPTQALQPAVGAETVAPSPVAAPASPSAQTAAAGGAAGVGGVAPMMHGARGDASVDKKRNPQLAADTELYTEDRPWTEAVIGNRVRRKPVTDSPTKETKESP